MPFRSYIHPVPGCQLPEDGRIRDEFITNVITDDCQLPEDFCCLETDHPVPFRSSATVF